jgi:hypothetical protein
MDPQHTHFQNHNSAPKASMMNTYFPVFCSHLMITDCTIQTPYLVLQIWQHLKEMSIDYRIHTSLLFTQFYVHSVSSTHL